MELVCSLRLPTDVRCVTIARHLTTAALSELGAEEESVEDVALAVTEACANVVQHADTDEDFHVLVTVSDLTCRIEVVDAGRTAAQAAAAAHAAAAVPLEPVASSPEALLTRGRGLALMRILVDQLHFEPDAHGTRVVLVKQLRPRAGAPVPVATASATASSG